jgi:hypothetical protein
MQIPVLRKILTQLNQSLFNTIIKKSSQSIWKHFVINKLCNEFAWNDNKIIIKFNSKGKVLIINKNNKFYNKKNTFLIIIILMIIKHNN